MRKTYFLLLLSVIMSWQIVNAIVIPESMWSFSSYVSAPKLKEIVTKLDNFVEEKTDNEAVVSNLNDSKNQVSEQKVIPTKSFSVQSIDNFVIYSCTAGTGANTYLFDLTELVSFYATHGIASTDIKVFYTLNDLNNDTNGVLAADLVNNYQSTSASEIFVRVTTIVNGVEEYVNYTVPLRSVVVADLELTINQTNSGMVCHNSPAIFSVVGTPNATVSYNVIIGGATQSYTYVIPESGTGTISTPNLVSGAGAVRFQVTQISQGSCGKALSGGAYTKNISVRARIDATLETITDPAYLCATNSVELKLSYTGGGGASAEITYTINGEINTVIATSSPFNFNVQITDSVRNSGVQSGDIVVEIDSIRVFNSIGQCRVDLNGVFVTIPFYNYFSCDLSNILPICLGGDAGNDYEFSNQPSVPNRGRLFCLGSTPNSFWKYFQVDQAGTLSYDIRQFDLNGSGRDVDFIAYGPFRGSLNPLEKDATLSSICCQITHINSFGDNAGAQSGFETIVACSYSASSTEEFLITNARPGDIYVVLMTNFSGAVGNIVFEESTGSTGSTSCDILCPLYLGEDFTACPGEIVTLRATIDGASSYQWYLNGELLVNETSQTLETEGEGLFKVIVNKGGCQIDATDEIRISREDVFDYNQPQDKVLCYPATFDLSNILDEIVADHSQYIVSYHLTNEGAVNATDMYTGSLTQFQPPTNNFTFYVALRSRTATCPVIVGVNLIQEDCTPPGNTPENLFSCEDILRPDYATFDLTNSIAQVLGQPESGVTYTVTAYYTEQDAINQTNAITSITQVPAINNTVIWYRKQNNDVVGAFTFFSHTLYVFDNPTITNNVNSTINICTGQDVTYNIEGTANATVFYNVAGGSEQSVVLSATETATITLEDVTASTTINFVRIEHVNETGVTTTMTCTTALTHVVTIEVMPIVELNVSANVQACLNTTSPTITLTPTGGTAPYTVEYTINGGAIQTAIFNTSTFDISVPTNTVGEFVYNFVSIKGTAAIECISTLDLTVNASIYNLPTATITGNTEVCVNDEGTYTIAGPANSTVVYTIDGVNNTVVLNPQGEYQFTHTVVTDVVISLVSVTDPSGCIGNLNQVLNVDALDLPTATIAGSSTICSGTTTELIFQGTANAVVTFTGGGQTYTVTLDGSGAGRFTTPALTTSTTFELVSIAGTCSNTLTGNAVVTVLDLPTATISGATQVCLNSTSPTVTFTGANGAAPYTFTYTINGGTQQTVTSTTNSVTVSVPTTTAGSFEYTLVSVSSSTNPNCNNTATGSTTITVLDLPTASVMASNNICLGSEGTITFTGTPNATITYTIDTVTQTIELDGSGTQSLTVTVNADVVVNLVSILDVQGCSNALTGTATITKVDLPTATISGSTTICNGTTTELIFQGTANAVVTFTGGGQTYTVTLDGSGAGRFTTPALTTNTTFELVSIAGACSNTLTGNAVVTVLDLPTATISGAQTICNGNNATFEIRGTANSTVIYTINGVSNTVTTTAAGLATITLNGLTVDTTVQLVSIATNNTISCSANLTEQIVISVIPVPTITNITAASPTICSGEATGIQISGNTPDVQFSWTVSATNGVRGAVAGTGNVISQQLTAGNVAGTVTYIVTPFIGGCEGATQQITITVTPVPVLTLTTGNFAICTNENAVIGISSNVAGATYTWNVVATNGIQGAVGGTGTEINQTLINNSNQVGTVTYTVTPYNGNCQGTPKTVVVTVYPKPTIIATPTQEAVCSGNQTNISLSSNVANTTYSWTVIANGVTGALPGSGSQIQQTLNAVGFVGTVEYIITPTVNGCVGDPTSVLVTVTPTPEIFANSNPPAICSESFTGISLSASIPGTTFEWTVVENGVEGAFAGTGSEINQQLFTTANAQGTAIYTVTPYSNGCAGNPITIRVRVNPLPLSRLKDGYICFDPITNTVISSYELTSGLSAASHTFVWSLDGVVIPGATAATYTAEQGGEYTLQVTNNNTNCTAIQTVFVSESYPAVSATYALTNYFESAQTITISVVGNGDYIYQLDDFAPQKSNVFNNVLPGTHTVTITDEQGCTYIVIENITTMQYPNFFTPNGDGINDTWNIWSLSNQQNALIYIYDRHGKLIKQISPRGQGWDGTINGTELPSTDYWFSVEYLENDQPRTFKSHFSLKR